jgi:hypothetical protein
MPMMRPRVGRITYTQQPRGDTIAATDRTVNSLIS